MLDSTNVSNKKTRTYLVKKKIKPHKNEFSSNSNASSHIVSLLNWIKNDYRLKTSHFRIIKRYKKVIYKLELAGTETLRKRKTTTRSVEWRPFQR